MIIVPLLSKFILILFLHRAAASIFIAVDFFTLYSILILHCLDQVITLPSAKFDCSFISKCFTISELYSRNIPVKILGRIIREEMSTR